MPEQTPYIDNRLISESTEDLYELAPCGFVSTLANGTIVKLNKTLLGWLGFESNELIFKKKFQDLLPIGGKIFFETHHAPLIKMQGFVNELSYELVGKDGQLVPVLTNAVSIKDESGKPSGYKYTFFNITDRKKYEKELLLAKRKAEQAVTAKSDFLSTISHEIRTPLNAIIGLTHILKEKNQDQENAEYLNILKFSANNLLGLINDILDLGKIESGKVILEEQDFNLKQHLQSVVCTIKIKTEKKGVLTKLQWDDSIPEIVIGDALKIGQVFTNLLGNASKFTESGQIILKAELVQLSEERVSILFSVSDTGIGIAKDKIDAIFEEFTQADSQIAIKYGGTGLGLSISKKIIELHGSKLSVSSEINKGSTFSFSLNLKIGKEENIEFSHSSNPNETKKLSGARILVCEDNPVNVLVVTKFLKDWDIEFDVAADGKAAVEKVQSKYFDLILMDLKMPVMDGYEATTCIRGLEGERFKKLPILAMTASTDPMTKEKASSLGMNGYVSKPFEPKDFYNKLVQFIPLNFLVHDFDKEYSEKVENNLEDVLSLNKYRELASGDAVFLQDLTEETVNNFKKYRAEFKKVFECQDTEKFKALAHKTKMVIDLLEIKRLNQYIEECAEKLNTQYAGNIFPSYSKLIDGEIGRVIEVLEETLNELSHK